MKRLLLWDIDGTLLYTQGVGRKSMIAAARDVFGFETDWARVDHVGRTDSFIFRRILENAGARWDDLSMQRFRDRYVELLEKNIAEIPNEPLPGVRELLDAAHESPDYVQGLLTGNFEVAARIKLRHFGLEGYFDFGAYGEESENRAALAPIALERASKFFDHLLDPQDIAVIGDTPHDLSCARALRARAVIVATGVQSMEELRVHGPDLLLADLGQVDGDPAALWTLEGEQEPLPQED